MSRFNDEFYCSLQHSSMAERKMSIFDTQKTYTKWYRLCGFAPDISEAPLCAHLKQSIKLRTDNKWPHIVVVSMKISAAAFYPILYATFLIVFFFSIIFSILIAQNTNKSFDIFIEMHIIQQLSTVMRFVSHCQCWLTF